MTLYEPLKVLVKKLEPQAILPEQANPGDAGWDLFLSADVTLSETDIVKARTGIAVQIPEGYYGHICEKSGLAAQGVTVHGGVVDAGYRGEVQVLVSLKKNQIWKQATRKLSAGSKIAQLVLTKIPYAAQMIEVEELTDSVRGVGGFGSSGETAKDDKFFPAHSDETVEGGIQEIKIGRRIVAALEITPEDIAATPDAVERIKHTVEEQIRLANNRMTEEAFQPSALSVSGGQYVLLIDTPSLEESWVCRLTATEAKWFRLGKSNGYVERVDNGQGFFFVSVFTAKGQTEETRTPADTLEQAMRNLVSRTADQPQEQTFPTATLQEYRDEPQRLALEGKNWVILRDTRSNRFWCRKPELDSTRPVNAWVMTLAEANLRVQFEADGTVIEFLTVCEA